MVIDLTKLKMRNWFEDRDGNIYQGHTYDLPKDKKYFTCHSIYPCTYTETVDSYTCHPEYEHEDNPFYQAMLHFKWFRKLMKKKYRNNMTFKPLFGKNITYFHGQDCIVAMVNSGKYTLEEAIYVYANSCERCINVLLYKYLDGKEGYEEFSEEWFKCNTVCDWCKNLGDGKNP